MKSIDKYFNIGAGIICGTFALVGLAIAIAGWIMPDFCLELRIGATIFGFGFLFLPCVLIIYMLMEK